MARLSARPLASTANAWPTWSGVVAHHEGRAGQGEGHPPVAGSRPLPLVLLGRQLVDDELVGCVGHRPPSWPSAPAAGRRAFRSGCGPSPRGPWCRPAARSPAGRGGLNRGGGDLTADHVGEILEREPEFGEPLFAVLRNLLLEALDKRLHRGIGDQLAVGRAVESLPQAPADRECSARRASCRERPSRWGRSRPPAEPTAKAAPEAPDSHGRPDGATGLTDVPRTRGLLGRLAKSS